MEYTRMDWRGTFDWIPIKNQGNCNCCWAMTAVTAVECCYFLSSFEELLLSTQQLIDCKAPNRKKMQQLSKEDRKKFFDKTGCYRSTINQAFLHLKNHGVCSEDNYRFRARRAYCYWNRGPKVQITSFIKLPEDEKAWKDALIEQPICAVLRCETLKIRAIGWNIYEGPPAHVPDIEIEHHAVLIVGFGHEVKDKIQTKYWIYRSTWGEDWGRGGHGRVCRQSSLPSGNIKAILRASYPVGAYMAEN